MARHSPTPKPWAPTEDEYLLGALIAGKTHGEIAEALGRPRSSIDSRLNTLASQGRSLPLAARPKPKAKCSNYLPVLKTPTTPRQCMCCGTTFSSQGPHNRMCSKCRLKAGDFSPLHP